jgi:hypothetical protein
MPYKMKRRSPEGVKRTDANVLEKTSECPVLHLRSLFFAPVFSIINYTEILQSLISDITYILYALT